MKQLTNNFKFIVIFLFLVLGAALIAQDKNDFDSKMKSLKGKVEKVTVKVDGKDVVFEGSEAEKITKLFSAGKNVMFMSKDKSDSKTDGKQVTVILNSDDKDAKEIEKTVQMDLSGGAKKIKIITNKDGKEETKVYEGEEAEKFIKENGNENHFEFKIDKKDGNEDNIRVFVDGDMKNMKDHIYWVGRHQRENEKSCCSNSCGKSRKHSKMRIRKFDKDSDEVKVILKKVTEDEKVKKAEGKEIKK